MQVLLKNDKILQYRRLALIIGIIHCIVFIFLIFSQNSFFIRALSAAGILVIVLIWLLKRKQPIVSGIIDPVNYGYFFLAITWLLFGYIWLVPVLLLLGILNWIAAKPPLVIISAESIIYPSIPRKIISWNELNNVVLKDNILTIDFKNDKLLQAEVDRLAEVNEKDFNVFVAGLLSGTS